MPSRILIMGLPGSGKTYLAQALKNYLETSLYFYGSIQRNDYVPDKSDIDVDLFTENINGTITKMQHFLDVDKTKFKKFIYKINNNIKIFLLSIRYCSC